MRRFFSTRKCILFLSVFFLFFLSFPHFIFAQRPTISNAPGYLSDVAGRAGVTQTDVPTYTGRLIQGILTAVGIVFFILMIYAGFRWMTARGDEEHATRARRTLFAAIMGLIIIISAYAITRFVTTRIVEGQANVGGDLDLNNADFTTLGCCFDQVRHPSASDFELRATNWEWRITSQGDCQEQGNKATTFDEIYGAGTWFFTQVSSLQECRALYETFCENAECYDLGF